MQPEIFDWFAEEFEVEFGRTGTYDEVIAYYEKRFTFTEEELAKAREQLIKEKYERVT